MDKDIFDAWLEYQKVAMHFNELLMKIRTQALAGLTTLTTIAGFVAKNQSNNSFDWAFMTCVLIILTASWAAIWFIDFRYYNRLLIGAVDEVLRIEALSAQQDKLDKICLSTQIEKHERTGQSENIVPRDLWERFVQGRVQFYFITAVGLVFGLILCAYEWKKAT